MGANAFEKWRYTFPDELSFPTLKVIRNSMNTLSGLTPKAYDCCLNSCACFVGPLADATSCPYCKTSRFHPDNTPVNRFCYVPILPQVQALYGGMTSALSMRYRSLHHDDNDDTYPYTITDIYDSKQYRYLRQASIVLDNRTLPHKYFEDPRDVLLISMTDGFQLFKRGKHTTWPLIFINANLDPAFRYHMDNVICAGLIPGPKKPRDFDSFMFVVTEELQHAAIGVRTYDAVDDEMFDLRVFSPYGCGDMPAVATVYTGGKHHNAKVPCRCCPIQGVRMQNSNNRIHYLPIQRPPDYPPSGLAAIQLPLRTHVEYLRQAKQVDLAGTTTESDALAKQFGINRTPITARIPGVRFPWSFPFDFMHLLENMLENYTLLISGEFKGLDAGHEDYILPKHVWDEIGVATVTGNHTIPSAFGRSIPNIAQDRTFFTAEAYLVWWTLFAPILLRDRFSHQKYYTHFTLFLSIINQCLDFQSTRSQRDQLRHNIAKWYSEYEE
jgi:hypothetical protein